MARGGLGWWLALGAMFFAQGGVDVRGDTRLAGPSQGSLPVASAATGNPGDGGGGGGGGGREDIPYPDWGPLILPIDGGNRRGVDAVGGASPSPSPPGGGGGGGGMRTDPEPPVMMGPWMIRFEPPPDRRGDAGPGGSLEPTLAPGSPAPRR